MTLRLRLLAAASFLLAAAPFDAAAFPWMVKHGYSTCAQCHADPSGAGVLTAYGRAQGEILLRTPWETRDEEWEPGRAAQAFFGIVPLPENVNVGFSHRSAQMEVMPEEGEGDSRFLVMQNEVRAHVRAGKLRFAGSLGASQADRTDATRITKNDEEDGTNLLSREHWIGWSPDDRILVRAGRTFMPFGIRQPEHYLWVREVTRTDIESTSQHGVSASFSGTKLRGELMLVAGNLAVSPDDYRERGYAGLVEWAITPNYVVGASSMLLGADADLGTGLPIRRSANGAYARLAPHEKVAILAELDVTTRSVNAEDPIFGTVSMLQVDVEPYQGIHLVATGETWQPDSDAETPPLQGGWISLVWYVLPHVDVRVDAVRRGIPVGEDDMSYLNLYLFQLHFFL